MRVVQPKKYLGQHFLTDHNIARKIVESLRSGKNIPVLEIGPGTGILTGHLIREGFEQLTLIEVDRESVSYLRKTYKQLNILHQDFLKINLDELFRPGLSIIGNFPYNISSQIFFRILNSRHLINEVVCMIQKEVALRLVAGPGTKTYGILSVLLKAYYDLELLFNVAPRVFDPPPGVQSAVIRLSRNTHSSLSCNEKLFVEIVKRAFNQRRKMLRNSLKGFLVNLPANLSILQQRPEQLSVEDFTDLTNWIEREQNT